MRARLICYASQDHQNELGRGGCGGVSDGLWSVELDTLEA